MHSDSATRDEADGGVQAFRSESFGVGAAEPPPPASEIANQRDSDALGHDAGDDLHVAARDDVAVAAANTAGGATLWRSADGRRWTVVRTDPFADHHVDVLTDTPSGFVAFGESRDGDQRALWTSRDAAWRSSRLDPATFGDADVHDLAVIGDAVVAVGYDASIDQAAFRIAEEGQTWRRIPSDETAFALK